ncbi:MAG: putative addiction module antidote protein [Rhizobiales bacterium 17-65-6]|nr:MAG: putative addiction module antidote protein [Azorhizobium sp. 32-67-21]OZA00440.1 MAG: putative addiction module antidote protein [Rhizobiales bacterium 17-65-6]
MALSTTAWDPAAHIVTIDDAVAYLEAAFEDGDPAMITTILGAIARSEGMTRIAREAGVSREGLYKALSENGDPRLSTFMGVLKALGLQLAVTTRPAA